MAEIKEIGVGWVASSSRKRKGRKAKGRRASRRLALDRERAQGPFSTRRE